MFIKRNIAFFFVCLAQLILFSHNSTPHHHHNQTNNSHFPIVNQLNIYTDLTSDILQHQIAELFLVNQTKNQVSKFQNITFTTIAATPQIIQEQSNNLLDVGDNNQPQFYSSCIIKHQQLRAPPYV